MKTIRISKADGRGGLAFDAIENFDAYEMELRGKMIFIMKKGLSEIIHLNKTEKDPKKDFGQILPVLRGAAFRILNETDFEVSKISKLRTTFAEELKEVIMGSDVKVAIDHHEVLKNLDKDTKK